MVNLKKNDEGTDAFISIRDRYGRLVETITVTPLGNFRIASGTVLDKNKVGEYVLKALNHKVADGSTVQHK